MASDASSPMNKIYKIAVPWSYRYGISGITWNAALWDEVMKIYSRGFSTLSQRGTIDTQRKMSLLVSSRLVSIHNLPLHVFRGGGTSDNLDQLASNDGLTGSVEENLVLADHLTGVLGSVLEWFVSEGKFLSPVQSCQGRGVRLTSMALRRADCSQAWPSARAQ